MTKNSRKLVLRVGSETTHAHGQVTCFSQALDNSQTSAIYVSTAVREVIFEAGIGASLDEALDAPESRGSVDGSIHGSARPAPVTLRN
jgi:hypothetical protein